MVHLTYQTAFVDDAGKLAVARRHLRLRRPHPLDHAQRRAPRRRRRAAAGPQARSGDRRRAIRKSSAGSSGARPTIPFDVLREAVPLIAMRRMRHANGRAESPAICVWPAKFPLSHRDTAGPAIFCQFSPFTNCHPGENRAAKGSVNLIPTTLRPSSRRPESGVAMAVGRRFSRKRLVSVCDVRRACCCLVFGARRRPLRLSALGLGRTDSARRQ